MTTIYRKYRPQRWEDVVGQDHITSTLRQEVASGRLAHAYLFSGPRGVGKTTLARILARAVNCETLAVAKRQTGAALATKEAEPCGTCASCILSLDGRTLDIIEIDAASHRGIDSVRENIIGNSRFAPSRLSRKVFIIDEVHMLTPDAWSALLKTLEEPPAQVIFVLATTELQKVPVTILSRCQRFDFRRIPFAVIVERLRRLAAEEAVDVDAAVIEEIARLAEGGLRDAESLLGKVLALGSGNRVTSDDALAVLPRSDRHLVLRFTDAVLAGNGPDGIAALGGCLEQGIDIEQFAADSTDLLRRTLLANVTGANDASGLDSETASRIADWARKTVRPRIIAAIELMLEKRRDLKTAIPAQLPLELVLARMSIEPGMGLSSSAQHVIPATAGIQTPSVVVPEPAPSSVALRQDKETPSVPQPLKPSLSQPFSPSNPPSLNPSVHPPTPPSIRPSPPLISLADLRARWSDIMKQVAERSASLTFVLGSAEPMGVSGGTVQIGLRFPFHRDKIMNLKNRGVIGDVLAAAFGQPLSIEAVLLEKSAEGVHTDGATVTSADPLAAAFGGRVVE